MLTYREFEKMMHLTLKRHPMIRTARKQMADDIRLVRKEFGRDAAHKWYRDRLIEQFAVMSGRKWL